MDAEDCLADVLGREVDKKDFIEAPFAQELRRELQDVVGGRDHEDGFLFLLHPRQEGADHARRRASVRSVAATHAGEAFLDFINPECARRQGLGQLKG